MEGQRTVFPENVKSYGGLCGRGVAESVLYQLREKPQADTRMPAGDELGTKSVGLG